jgi:DNA-binding NarL/FixJ family response regulator
MLTKLYAIGILEDNEALRKNIELYLGATRDCFVGFSESSIENILLKDIDCDPDYILLDIHLNNTNSLESISRITKRFPGAGIIVMTGDKSESFILNAFENGAKGYIYKPFALQELVSTIKSLEENGSYMPANIATKLIGLLNKKDKVEPLKNKYKLTERETQIIEFLRDGHGYQAIADKLFISYHTVNHHIKKLYSKLNVNSRSELTATYLLNNSTN